MNPIRSFPSLLWFILGMLGCTPDRVSIESVVEKVFAEGGLELYASAPDSNWLSTGLCTQMEAVRQIRQWDEERIRLSPFPTDKPLMVDGNVWVSLIEGFSDYTVHSVSISGDTARAIMELTYAETEHWNDTVILIRQRGWKVDNVRYGAAFAPEPDLRSRLEEIETDWSKTVL